MSRRTDILIITPATTGGSWTFFDGFLRRLDPSIQISVCSGQKLEKKPHKMQFFSLPMPRYDKYGLLINSQIAFVIAYSIPLLLLANLVMLIERPRLIIGNGFGSCYGVLPISRLAKSKMIISHHGYFARYVPESLNKLIGKLQRFVDLVVVNSATSKKDVETIISKKKLRVIEHWADQQFFQDRNREQLRSDLGMNGKFVIVFAGRIDREKHVPFILETAMEPSLKNDFLFYFCGTGEMAKQVQENSNIHSNIRYLDYISDRDILANLFTAADLVWAYADESYLARPAVEALACGTPILVSDKPAVIRKAMEGVKVPEELVKGIGWIIKIQDPSEAAKFLLRLKDTRILDDNLRNNCKVYARQKHDVRNLDAFISFVIRSISG